MLLGSLLCLLAVTAWGFMFPVMANALQFIDPFFFTTIRYGSAAIIFLILLFITEGKTSLHLEKEHFRYSFTEQSVSLDMVFSFFTANNLRAFWGHSCCNDSISYAAHRFIIAVDNKNKRPQNYTFLCMFVALLGVMLVISKGNIHFLFGAASHLSTNILMLCGVTCWVIYTNGGARFQSWSPLRYTTLTCLFGSVSLIVIVTFFTYTNIVTMPSLRTIMSVRFELLYMSIVAGVIAVFCWNTGNRYISSINGILFMNLVPVLALIGSIFRGYTVDKIEIAGASLTIIALLCNNVWQRKESTKIPTSVR